MKPKLIRSCCLSCAAIFAVTGASMARSAELLPDTAFIDLAAGSADTNALSLGAGWKSAWQHAWLGGHFSISTELFVSQWRTNSGPGAQSYSLLGVVPLLRYDFHESRRWPLFVEAGIGLSVLNREFQVPQRHQGSTWNFYDTVAAGVHLDAGWEASLRLSHLSNAGLKKPNPGQSFLHVRVTKRF